MKWLLAVAKGIGIFIVLLFLIFGFHVIMRTQVEQWMKSNVILGIIPQLAISLDLFLYRYLLFVIPIIFITCLAGACIGAARKE